MVGYDAPRLQWGQLMPQPDFSKLINLPQDSIMSELSRSPGQIGFLDAKASIEAGLRWWVANEPLLQKRVCGAPGLKLLSDTLEVASTVFGVLKEVLGEHRATYAAVLIAQKGLGLFCKSYWSDSPKGQPN